VTRKVRYSAPLALRACAELTRRRIARGEEDRDRTRSELDRCAADPAYFIDTHVRIQDTQGDGSELPFRLWDGQRSVLATFDASDRVIVLKARQLGISWLAVAYAVWLAVFRPGRLILVFSKGQLEADELLRRARFIYDRLPGWIQAVAPHRPGRDKATINEFGLANGSRIRSLPATRSAGRSFTASLILFDEAAFAEYAGELYNAAKPTIDHGGRIVIFSTANGIGGFFHAQWTKAVAGTNGFATAFLPWWSRPGRDADWYARVLAEAHDPALVPQEYPANPTEAFVASGRSRFPYSWVSAQAANVRGPIAEDIAPVNLREMIADGSLALYATPAELAERRVRAFISADPAEGRQAERGRTVDPDYSVAVLLDADGTEWGTLSGRWEPDEFAARLWTIAQVYRVPVLVERNNHGHAVLLGLRHRGGVVLLAGHDGTPGWATTPATRPEAIAALAARLRDGRLAIRSQATIDEMQVFRVDETGKASAPPGHHDDRVMAWANACGWLDRFGGFEMTVY
jgi:hypothetical protein